MSDNWFAVSPLNESLSSSVGFYSCCWCSVRFCIYTEGWLWCAWALISFILAADSFQCAEGGGDTYIPINRNVWKKEFFWIAFQCCAFHPERPEQSHKLLHSNSACWKERVPLISSGFLITDRIPDWCIHQQNYKGLIVQKRAPNVAWACWYLQSTQRVPWVTGWGVPQPCTRHHVGHGLVLTLLLKVRWFQILWLGTVSCYSLLQALRMCRDAHFSLCTSKHLCSGGN